jgi:hypothetical protein
MLRRGGSEAGQHSEKPSLKVQNLDLIVPEDVKMQHAPMKEYVSTTPELALDQRRTVCRQLSVFQLVSPLSSNCFYGSWAHDSGIEIDNIRRHHVHHV